MQRFSPRYELEIINPSELGVPEEAYDSVWTMMCVAQENSPPAAIVPNPDDN